MRTQAQSLIRELEDSIRKGSNDQRVTTLRRVTDLFLHRAERLDEEQIRLFDDVIGRLAAEIEEAALAELSRRLAPVENAPYETIRNLAHQDSIAVSGPVLARSPRLSDGDLVEIARTRGQPQLLAIAGRDQLGEAVTDVLVERGDGEVVHKVVGNVGARFSDLAFTELVDRAKRDDRLAENVGRRIDIPPHLFRKLMSQATERVQARLLSAAEPGMRTAIEEFLSDISRKVEAKPELASRSYSAAKSYVQLLAQSGRLGRRELVNFAREGRFEETVVALSELSGVPLDIVDRVMHGDGLEPLLVLCKAKEFDWQTVRPIILVRRDCRKLAPSDLEDACQDFNSLSVATADRVLRFWQVRQTGQ
ncbi:MAG: DUF2336 domain-containing protein [Bradyrhizobiaceae bacterium]|nr:DUF2336 domain-containing protein [Bradyrhizobiaceae bacterium]